MIVLPQKTLQDLEKENKSVGDEEIDSDLAKIHIDDQGKLLSADQKSSEQPAAPAQPSNMVMQPPTLGGPLSAAMQPQDQGSGQPAVDAPPEDHTSLQHAKTLSPLSEQEKAGTLADIEQSVNSPHTAAVDAAPVPSADDARQAIQAANAAAEPTRLEPLSALNAQPMDLEEEAPAPQTTEEVFPPQLIGPDNGLPPDPTAAPADPTAPPPVPPPMMPPQ